MTSVLDYSDADIAAAIRSGIDYINTYGWRQGSFPAKFGQPACMMQSVRFADEQYTWWTLGMKAQERLYYQAQVRFHQHAAEWNDDPQRTKQEVLAFMNSVATKIEENL